MLRFLEILLIAILLYGCSNDVPKEVIPEKKMTDILFDLHLAEGYALTVSPASTEKINYVPAVYMNYETDSASVRRSLEYYASHPQKLQDIYAEISKRLQAMEADIEEQERLKNREILRADSIKRKRTIDSIYFRKRDSILRFDGKSNLLMKRDSVHSKLKDWSLPKEQNRLELIFGYPLKKDTAMVIVNDSLKKPSGIAPASKEPN